MSARTWALGLVCSLTGSATALTVGCSSQGATNAITSSGGGDAGINDAESWDSGTRPLSAEDDESESDDAGTKPIADAGSRCNPSAVDDPDDDFTDSNCDGIDGDKTKAVFVAPTGSDTADGSMATPVATLGHGIELAIANNKDVYVCKGDYTQAPIQLNSKGVRVYGGYDCTAQWARNSQSQAHFVSTSSTALSIKNVSDAVVFDRVDIASKSGTSSGESSMAVFVSNSQNVTLRRGTFEAGNGANGAQPSALPDAVNSNPNCFAYVYSTGGCYGEPGTDAYQYKNCYYFSGPTSGTIAEAPFTDTTVFSLAAQPAPTQTNQCHNSTSSVGGKGGGTDPKHPLFGINGSPGSPPSTSGNPNGNNGAPGTAGTAATQGFGELNDGGYLASNSGTQGTGGILGEAGTGGSGGGFIVVYQAGANEFQYFYYAPQGGGGNGGWGGCGGDGGAAGNAGGASIAVASYRSQVNLERATLVASNGGTGSAGGLGAKGAAGQPGGIPGAAHYQCAQCVAGEESLCAYVNNTYTNLANSGGHGGKGGDGAQGGPGGGGPSISLLLSGSTPTLSAVTFLPGAGGLGGSNGGNRAADGESIDQKVIP